MLRTLVARLLWLGRLTSALVGLALLLGVALGAGTAALAAVPGDPLKLGQVNTINALTSLTGRSGTALLKLDGLDAGGFAPRLWAKVRFDGTLLHGNGATSARREPAGAGFQYFVAFDRSVAACGYVATVGEDFAAYDPPGEIQAALATLPSQTDTVFVSIDAGTTTVARQFSLMVLC